MNAAAVHVPTADLDGAALNWAVQSCVFADLEADGTPVKAWVMDRHNAGDVMADYCRDWAHSGPIIERHRIAVRWIDGLNSWIATAPYAPDFFGPSPIVAALRCYVWAAVDDVAVVPAELVPTAPGGAD